MADTATKTKIGKKNNDEKKVHAHKSDEIWYTALARVGVRLMGDLHFSIYASRYSSVFSFIGSVAIVQFLIFVMQKDKKVQKKKRRETNSASDAIIHTSVHP